MRRSAEPGSTAGISFEEFKARTYREPSTGLYVLDWDIVVCGDDALHEVWERRSKARSRSTDQRSGHHLERDAAKQLTYCMSNTFGANKPTVVDALAQATEHGWEKIADVNFIYVPGEDANCNAENANVMFDVNPVNANGQYLARSFFPNSPRAERNVLIDNTAFQPGGTGTVSLNNIIGHELGHTIGFRHEHIRPEANATQCAEDNQFRGLTTYDSASVMHYPQCNGTSTDLSFTQRDKEGVVLLYGAPLNNPSPMTQVTAPSEGATVGQTFDVQASIIDSDLVKAELSIDGALTSTLNTAPFTFHVANLAVGAHTLDIKATDGAGQSTTRPFTSRSPRAAVATAAARERAAAAAAMASTATSTAAATRRARARASPSSSSAWWAWFAAVGSKPCRIGPGWRLEWPASGIR